MPRQKADFIPEVDELVYEVGAGNFPAKEPKTGHDRKFEELLESFASQPNVKLSVYRQRGGLNDGLTLLDTFPVDKYDYEGLHAYVKRAYGEGDYRIQIRENGRLKANELMTIEMPKDLAKVEQGDNVTSALLMELREMRQQLMQQREPIAQQSPMDQMAQLMQMMVMMKQVMGPQQSTPMGEIIGTIQGLRELGLNFGGQSEEKEDGFMGFLGQLAPVLGTIAQGAMGSQTASAHRGGIPHQIPGAGISRPPTQVAQPSTPMDVPRTPTGQTQNVQQNEKASEDMNLQLMAFRAALGPLVSAAKKDGDVTLYTDFILDQIPDKLFPSFVTMMEADDWFTQLKAMAPGVEPYQEWFTSLRSEILLALSEDDETDNGGGDDDDDVSTDGHSRRTGGNSDDGQNNEATG